MSERGVAPRGCSTMKPVEVYFFLSRVRGGARVGERAVFFMRPSRTRWHATGVRHSQEMDHAAPFSRQ